MPKIMSKEPLFPFDSKMFDDIQDLATGIDIQKQCKKVKVPFFFKQWGGKNKKLTGRLLNGRTWDEMPKIPA
jgi:protein gp37